MLKQGERTNHNEEGRKYYDPVFNNLPYDLVPSMSLQLFYGQKNFFWYGEGKMFAKQLLKGMFIAPCL